MLIINNTNIIYMGSRDDIQTVLKPFKKTWKNIEINFYDHFRTSYNGLKFKTMNRLGPVRANGNAL